MEAQLSFGDTNSPVLKDAYHYRQLIRNLIYFILTCLKIVDGVLSQFMHELHEVHKAGALRLILYINLALRKGLILKMHVHIHVEAYSNSRYDGDRGDQNSTAGY